MSARHPCLAEFLINNCLLLSPVNQNSTESPSTDTEPEQPIDDTQTPTTCPICLDPAPSSSAPAVQVQFPTCNHILHATCLSDYILSRANKCPLCREVWFTLPPVPRPPPGPPSHLLSQLPRPLTTLRTSTRSRLHATERELQLSIADLSISDPSNTAPNYPTRDYEVRTAEGAQECVRELITLYDLEGTVPRATRRSRYSGELTMVVSSPEQAVSLAERLIEVFNLEGPVPRASVRG